MFTDHSMSDSESNGFVKTLNNMGYMTSTQDPFSSAFVEYSTNAPGPVLEISAAYGIATLPALNKGSRVIANDIDSRHLEILASRVSSHFRNNMNLAPGRFPEELEFDSESLGAVLIARVFHFFSGELLELSAAKLYKWLATGGRVFIVAETPYLKNFQNFIPTYEKMAVRAWV